MLLDRAIPMFESIPREAPPEFGVDEEAYEATGLSTPHPKVSNLRSRGSTSLFADAMFGSSGTGPTGRMTVS